MFAHNHLNTQWHSLRHDLSTTPARFPTASLAMCLHIPVGRASVSFGLVGRTLAPRARLRTKAQYFRLRIRRGGKALEIPRRQALCRGRSELSESTSITSGLTVDRPSLRVPMCQAPPRAGFWSRRPRRSQFLMAQPQPSGETCVAHQRAGWLSARWVEARGMGFIQPSNGGEDLFVHRTFIVDSTYLTARASWDLMGPLERLCWALSRARFGGRSRVHMLGKWTVVPERGLRTFAAGDEVGFAQHRVRFGRSLLRSAHHSSGPSLAEIVPKLVVRSRTAFGRKWYIVAPDASRIVQH